MDFIVLVIGIWLLGLVAVVIGGQLFVRGMDAIKKRQLYWFGQEIRGEGDRRRADIRWPWVRGDIRGADRFMLDVPLDDLGLVIAK